MGLKVRSGKTKGLMEQQEDCEAGKPAVWVGRLTAAMNLDLGTVVQCGASIPGTCSGDSHHVSSGSVERMYQDG